MEFCDCCNNMLYIRQDIGDDTTKIEYFCKHCTFSKNISDSNTSKMIISTSYNSDDLNFDSFLNENVIYDKTIPHVNNIKCINPSCTKKSDDVNDVMCIKYDTTNFKFMYFCVYCKQFWKHSS